MFCLVQVSDSTNKSVLTLYGIPFPSSLNGTVASAEIGESEQSFKPFRLQISYSKLQFTATLTLQNHSIQLVRGILQQSTRPLSLSDIQKTTVTPSRATHLQRQSCQRKVEVQNCTKCIVGDTGQRCYANSHPHQRSRTLAGVARVARSSESSMITLTVHVPSH